MYKFENIENVPHIKIYEDKWGIYYLTIYTNEFETKRIATKHIRKNDSHVFIPWNMNDTRLEKSDKDLTNHLYDSVAHILLASEYFEAAKTFIKEEEYNETGDCEDPESEFSIFIDEVEKYLKEK